MDKHSFTPGTRVRVFPRGLIGRVADLPEFSRQFKGFTPVIFDGRDKATPCDTQKLFALEPAPIISPMAKDVEPLHYWIHLSEQPPQR